MDLYYLYLRSNTSNHLKFPPKWIIEVNTGIYLDSNYFEIGTINSYILNYKQMIKDKVDIYKVFSSINEHARIAYGFFAKPASNFMVNIEAILYLNELFVNENNRGQGIGTKVLKMLPEHLRHLNDTTLTHIFLYPFPLNKTENGIVIPDRNHTERITSLKKFYSKNGFYEINLGNLGTCLYLKEISKSE